MNTNYPVVLHRYFMAVCFLFHKGVISILGKSWLLVPKHSRMKTGRDVDTVHVSNQAVYFWDLGSDPWEDKGVT